MNTTAQVWQVTLFLLRDLTRSLVGAAPPALTLFFYALTFTYPADITYFTAVAGAALMLVSFIVTLIVGGWMNRSLSYPLLVHLHHRWQLLISVALAALLISLGMALLFTILALVQDKIAISLVVAVQIAGRWLALFIVSISLGLHTCRLINRRGYFWTLGSLVLLFSVDEWRGLWERWGILWPVHIVDAILWPVLTLLRVDPHLMTSAIGVSLLLAGLATLGIAAALLGLAVYRFHRRDLDWDTQ